MTTSPYAVIISTSPMHDRLDASLARYLGKSHTTAQWIYSQPSPDVYASVEEVLYEIEEYLAPHKVIHLIGHSINGMLAFLYAQKFPDRVSSLTLLSVGNNLAMNWIAQYYFQFNFSPSCRSCLLKQVAMSLFGRCSKSELDFYINLLEKELINAFSPHSPFNIARLAPQPTIVPLLVCGSQDDLIVDPNAVTSWSDLLKPTDRLEIFPHGRHYFHHYYPEQVGQTIEEFWQKATYAAASPCLKVN